MPQATAEKVPTREELISRAGDLIPLFRRNAERTERESKVPDENMTALREAGLLRLSTPAKWGGWELPMRQQAEVLCEIGRGCPSTGWIAANHAASVDLVMLMPEPGLERIYGANQDAVMLSAASLDPQLRADRVEGGVKVSGRFPYASGCELSDWAFLAWVPVFEGDRRIGVSNLLSPPGELRIEHTWTVAGLLGTGTHAMVAEDLFVPDRFVQFAPLNENGDAESPIAPTVLIKGNLHSLSSLVGAARGALDLVRAKLEEHKPLAFSTYSRAIDSLSVQQEFAEATHLIDTGVLHMLAVADGFDAVPEGEEATPAERARLRMHMVTSLERCREAMQRLLDLAGTSGFAQSNPVQRYWRDLEIGSRHTALNRPMIFEDYARSLLGTGDPVSLLF
ncbi:3-hydroxy-9,10-secoandrosta-1,3,5(10)-triene-9,17-dione monooxygenase [Streptomyces aurantiacus]|uniref:acyl-CoA dehydrogenase family protein n=1 Tax=Streptomyces aurantiacus TaxID=47760 RepID=UPI00278E49AB|nr:acyl-CoA dehydrogenase family protein [Streptomyces aurantiacus]MDQ0779956.1 3-hydroxy-9,10-secoandrosta-1,3,5(10)-triene-9,17-dione monooxygenase [Streptomyces aurantiacus]